MRITITNAPLRAAETEMQFVGLQEPLVLVMSVASVTCTLRRGCSIRLCVLESLTGSRHLLGFRVSELHTISRHRFPIYIYIYIYIYICVEQVSLESLSLSLSLSLVGMRLDRRTSLSRVSLPMDLVS